MSSKIKRTYFYADRPYIDLCQAISWRTAAKAANVWGANPNLVLLYRSWMRSHAIGAVQTVKAAKVA